jgi:putative FmdB family regulatory protein
MPTYEYLCKSCKREWEADQSITEEPLTDCPYCKDKTAQRLISGGTYFQLLGNGWASDGYSK